MLQKIIITSCMMLGLVSQQAQATSQSTDIATYLSRSLGVRMVIPFAPRTDFGNRQIGVLFTNLEYASFGSTRPFNWQATRSCIASASTFPPDKTIGNKTFAIEVGTSSVEKARVRRIFKLLESEAEHIETITLALTDIQVTAPDKEKIFDGVLKAGWADTTYCKPVVFCGPKRTFVVSRLVEAAVEIEIAFKENTSVSLANFVGTRVGTTFGLDDPRIPTNIGQTNSPPVRVGSGGKPLVVGFGLDYWREIMARRSYSCAANRN